MRLKWLFIMFFLPLVGCATIVSNDPGKVTISSDPPKADCKVANSRTGEELVSIKTPSMVTLETSQGYFKSAKYSITCQKEGYLEARQPLEAGFDGWYVGNLLFGGLIGFLIVDPATGAMWDIEQTNMLVKLTPSNRIGYTANEIEEMKLLVRGKVTMDEIKMKLGDPSDTQTTDSGNKYWGYYYEAEPKKLVLQFDKSGVLKDYLHRDI